MKYCRPQPDANPFYDEGQEPMKQTVQQTPSLRLATNITTDQQDNRRRRLSRTHLINSLNSIHFADGEISLRFRHNKYQSVISLPAKPQACNDTYLQCLWVDLVPNQNEMKYYTFDGFTFTDGYKQIQVPAELIEMNKQGVNFELPEYSYETFRRGVKRHDCQGISAQITQDGWFVTGKLFNFTAQAIAVNFHHEFSLLKNEIDPKLHVHLVLKRDNEFIFSGTCCILRQKNSNDKKILVLKPLAESVHRMKSKEFRSERLVPTPLPNIIFQHPIIQKKIHLRLNDISGLGFSVEEDMDNAVLLPGMVIPELEIEFMHGFSVQCKSQVLYRVNKGDVAKCGVVILDMSMRDHLKLSSFIHQAKNKNSYISTTNIDIEALWNFFFDSGFIYPEKYLHLAAEKEKFIATYRNLHKNHPEIVQQIIYQDKGKIYGHISIQRCYSKTWLLHHLAAIKSTKHKAGLVVLEQIFNHINEIHSLPSAKMDYLAGYFRPNNRFSSRLFGPETVHAINDLNKCSVDEFAYFHYVPGLIPEQPSSSDDLSESTPEDLSILRHWYDEESGGLAIRAMDLLPEKYSMDSETNKEYLAAGFKRDRKLFSFKKDDDLIAVLIANISDFGLNMSDLTNCIQIFVLDQKNFDKNIAQFALQQIATYYDNDTTPVLLYPKSYADSQGFSYEKTYNLGILNLEYINDYLDFKNSLTSHRKPVDIIQIN